MKECKSCGEEIKDETKRCPYCGELTPKEERKRIVLYLFFGGCFIGLLCDYFSWQILRTYPGPSPDSLGSILEIIFTEPIMWVTTALLLATFSVLIYLDSTEPE